MSFAEQAEGIIARAGRGLYQAGTMVMEASQPFVPVEYGTLKRSGHVEEPVEDGDRLVVTVGYGYGTEVGPDGQTADQYAVYVHEIARYQHAPPTMYKYLEVPARAFEPQLPVVLGEAIRGER